MVLGGKQMTRTAGFVSNKVRRWERTGGTASTSQIAQIASYLSGKQRQGITPSPAILPVLNQISKPMAACCSQSPREGEVNNLPEAA